MPVRCRRTAGAYFCKSCHTHSFLYAARPGTISYSHISLNVNALLWIPDRIDIKSWVEQARGKSGPLFNFDVHEDVRLINDARVEKDESHAGKVVQASCPRARGKRHISK